MSLYKKWIQEKRPTFKFLKSTKNQMTGDLIIVSDQKNYILDLGSKYLDKWQFEDLKKNIKLAQWTYNVEGLTVHLYLHADLNDVNVGGFESCSYYMFKRFLGQKLSLKQDVFNLIMDPKFKLAEDFVNSFAEAVCSISYNYKIQKPVDLKISIESEWQVAFKSFFLKAEALNLARFLVDLPPNELNPTTYSDFIKEMVGADKNYKFESISKDLENKGYGLIHAVGKGSKNQPQLVRVVGGGSKQKKVAFVGKGITFDTGGLDLKPSKFMRNMKKDMGGSATAASVLYYLIQAKKGLPIDFYFALAENSMDGNSFRPGDICKAGNGLTVEIDNTDAEGRLVLADALSWLSKEKQLPSTIVDVATLTGAIKVGLGTHIGGLFSNDKKLSDELFGAGLDTGDFVWPMPMPFWSESEMTKTDVADLVNSSQSGYGGAITAAQFLKFFVPKNVKWAHLDIYSWVDSKRDVIRQSGGSGQAVMLLIRWLEKHI